MASYFLKGVLIGLIFGLPVGAVGALTVQRTWKFGIKAGLLTGLGSSVADCFYALVGAFGLTLISDLLLEYKTSIHLLGGGLILFMGVRLLFRQAEAMSQTVTAMGSCKLFITSFAIGITNPAAILTFLFAFSYFGISGVANIYDGVAIICGVFLGTYLWWGAISFATYKMKQKSASYNLGQGNRMFGAIFVLLGAAILAQSFLK